MKKIVIIGPESTGKSTLCKQLADHFNTLCCPEFAREYLEIYGPKYTYDDLLTIAKGQAALEDERTAKVQSSINQLSITRHQPATTNAPLLFVDTDMHVLKVWCEFVFGKCHDYIIEQIATRQYDLFLLCNIDLPWVKDELREYPDFRIRENLYEIYKGILKKQPVPWVVIYGNYEDRLRSAIEVVDKLVAGKSKG